MEVLSALNSQLSSNAQIAFITFCALIFGSFASLISHRLATKQPMVFARSQCVKCGIALKIRNLIPIFSWVIQRGKCSNCKAKISARYPLIEASFVITFLSVYFALGQVIDIRMLLCFAISGTLIVMTVVDLEHYFIPDITQYFLALLVIFLRIHDDGTNGAMMNLQAAFLYMGFGLLLLAFFYITTKMEAIGIDDIKFFFISGLLLGSKGFLLFMLFSGVFGVIFGMIWQKVKKEATFPFAPSICAAMFVVMMFGKDVNLTKLMGDLIF